MEARAVDVRVGIELRVDLPGVDHDILEAGLGKRRGLAALGILAADTPDLELVAEHHARPRADEHRVRPVDGTLLILSLREDGLDAVEAEHREAADELGDRGERSSLVPGHESSPSSGSIQRYIGLVVYESGDSTLPTYSTAGSPPSRSRVRPAVP